MSHMDGLVGGVWSGPARTRGPAWKGHGLAAVSVLLPALVLASMWMSCPVFLDRSLRDLGWSCATDAAVSVAVPDVPSALGGLVIGVVLAASLPRLRRSRRHDERARAVSMVDGPGRARAVERLEAALRERDLRLRETHHRVKNNLQTLYSLLRLQSDRLRDSEAVAVFRESQERIRAIALLHDLLARSQDPSTIAVGAYVQGVTAGLMRAFGVSPARVRLDLAIEPVAVGIDTAIPCGLIINELVSNSLKHAFPGGRTGRIAVSWRAGSGGTYELTVADDGIGASAESDGDGQTGFGLELIRMLARQLGGTLERRRESGTSWRLVFKESRG